MGEHGATGWLCEFRKLKAEVQSLWGSYVVVAGEAHLAWIHRLIAAGGQLSLLFQYTRSCIQILPIS